MGGSSGREASISVLCLCKEWQQGIRRAEESGNVGLAWEIIPSSAIWFIFVDLHRMRRNHDTEQMVSIPRMNVIAVYFQYLSLKPGTVTVHAFD